MAEEAFFAGLITCVNNTNRVFNRVIRHPLLKTWLFLEKSAISRDGIKVRGARKVFVRRSRSGFYRSEE